MLRRCGLRSPGRNDLQRRVQRRSYLYRPDKALRRALDGGTAYLRAWAMALAAISLTPLGALALGVGFFYSSVWAWSVVGYAFSGALVFQAGQLPNPSHQAAEQLKRHGA